MAYIYSGQVRRLVGKPLVGNGNCVVLVQQLVKLPHHSRWRQGQHVVDVGTLWPGTAIATFENGVYPNWPTGNHVAFFAGPGPKKPDGSLRSFWIVEQYKGSGRIQLREISSQGQVDSKWGKRWKDPSNNADAFYVID